MNTLLLSLLFFIAIGFIVITNYRKLELESKVEEIEIKLDTNIENRIQENFSNLPKLNFTTDSNFYKNKY